MIEKMENCEFKERLVIVKYLSLISFLIFLAIFWIASLVGKHFGALAFCAVLFISSVILGAAALILYSFKGLIRADQSGVYIRIILFGKTLSEKFYEYDDIERASCTVEKHNTRNLKYYEMVFVFELVGEKKLCFSKRLRIRFNLERKNPSAYLLVTSSEPMMRLYDFVMTNKKRISDEKYLQ